MTDPNLIHVFQIQWFLFISEKNIQTGMHDSAEDARVALYLYKRYQQLQADGPETVQAAISDLYETGRRMMWKVPDMPDDPTFDLRDLDDPNFWQTNQDGADDIMDPNHNSFFDQ